MNLDWMKKYQGRSRLALLPSTCNELSSIIKYCHARSLAIVPQGGNTGLVGGGVPLFDEVIVSTRRMNKVISFDPVGGQLVAEAGCTLASLGRYIEKHSFMMPYSFGSKEKCVIGGNVATSAGGMRLLRYGGMQGSILGLEAVTGDGTILNLLSTMRKDNTGLQLKNLFIGSEGLLGIITKVAIHCVPLPSSIHSAFLSLPSFSAVSKTLVAARSCLSEILASAEFLDSGCLRLVTSHLPGVKSPLSISSGRFFMLIETHGSDMRHDCEKLELFLNKVKAEGLVSHGVVATSSEEQKMMWRCREGIAEACSKRGRRAVYKYDISLPTEGMYDLVGRVQVELESKGLAPTSTPSDDPAAEDERGYKAFGYGHVGDGNLHLNVTGPDSSYRKDVEEVLDSFVYDYVASQGGSISAEHGIGRMKRGALMRTKSKEALEIMTRVKSVLDPQMILNPYKVID